MSQSHGNTSASKLINAPHSRSFAGPFGRMFRTLPAWDPGKGDEAATISEIARIAAEMDEGANSGSASGDNATIPAGYTYFGQFVDHDLTFDPRSSLQKHNDPESLEDFRSPAFDLDCLYGRGPADQPYMFDKGKFRIFKHLQREGEKPNPLPNPPPPVVKFDDEDLPRYGGDKVNTGRALIGDKRNDENTIVSQLQLIFLKFHNQVFEQFTEGNNIDARFDKAQRFVRWHYQWVVVHDWLTRLCGKDVVRGLLKNPECPSKPKLCYYNPHHHPFMPLEFSVAAYRLGHSMIRGAYRINSQVAKRLFSPQGSESEFTDFRGFRTLPAGWTIDWSFLFDFSAATAQPDSTKPIQSKPALSRKLDRFLVNILTTLPDSIAEPGDVPKPTPAPTPPGADVIVRSLAFRNLLRGWRLGLPSGEAVAALMGVTTKDTKMDLNANTPLWRYILDEAATDGKGQTLGPVGAAIVAETILGLLAADPSSYLRNNPLWQPDLGVKPIDGQFELRDIIRFAGGRIGS
jgi:hypothetical protein